MSDRLLLVLEVAGLAVAAVGLGLAWPPLGVIATGVAMVVIANSPDAARTDSDEADQAGEA